MTFYNPEAANEHHVLPGEESIHCIRVLRHKKGDAIEVLDGLGGTYEAVIEEAHPKHCRYVVMNRHQADPDPYSFHLAIAPTKNADRMEWMVEKCVEIGIHQLTFLQCENSERSKLRMDRLEKKAIAAMKQSGRKFIPEFNTLIKFDRFLEHCPPDTIRHIAHVPMSAEAPHLKTTKLHGHYIVLVGPEGDFSPREAILAMDYGFAPTSLGNSILRTETAGLIACHTLALINT